MRKSEPDSKYFGKSSENEVFPVKNYKNHPKLFCSIHDDDATMEWRGLVKDWD